MKKLTGKTYIIREEIKRVGGTWNAIEKCWMVPDEEHARLEALIPKKILNGQLWEECYNCGQEPVYLSLGGLCDRCG